MPPEVTEGLTSTSSRYISDVSNTQCTASQPAGGFGSISSTADIAMLAAPCWRTHGVVERGRGIEIATKRTMRCF